MERSGKAASKGTAQARRNKIAMNNFIKWIIVMCFVAAMSGCLDGLKSDNLVKHPDAPMLITETKGKHVKVSIYDKERNQLIEFGWIEINENMKGWTITKYDWETFIKKREQ